MVRISILLLLFANIVYGKCPTVQETWNTQTRVYNTCDYIGGSFIGREGCLKKFKPHQSSMHVYCGEKSPNSTFIRQAIRVRMHVCDSSGCRSFVKDLTHGECIPWKGSGLFSKERFCARIAFPENRKGENKIPADHGYSKDQVLDEEGVLKDSEFLKIGVYPQRLCLYRDPWGITGGDPLDRDDYYQPVHKNSGKKSKMLQSIGTALEVYGEVSSSLMHPQKFVILAAEFALDKAGIGGGTSRALKWARKNLDPLDLITRSGGKFLGSFELNEKVDDVLGCVDILPGPYPPPYCHQIKPVPDIPVVSKICSIKGDNDDICEISDQPNNAIYNTVRVSFNRMVQKCDGKKDGECVNIKGIVTSNMMYSMNNKIKPCNITNGAEPCFVVRREYSNNCNNGCRIIYGVKYGKPDSVTVTYNYSAETPECTQTSNSTCQYVWGVDVGDYKDISVKFPEYESSNSSAVLRSNTIKLVNSNKQTYQFYAVIERDLEHNKERKFAQLPNEICVYAEQDSRRIGCVDRATPSKPRVYGCDAPNVHSELKKLCRISTHFDPNMVVELEEDNYKTQAILYAKSLAGNLSFEQQSIDDKSFSIDIAGYSFSSMVTDDNFITPPFTGTNNTRIGNYASTDTTQHPLMKKGSDKKIHINDKAIYLNGLEYIDGYYFMGGSWMCISNNSNMQNTQGKKGMVLTKRKNTKLFPCEIFNKQINNIKVCDSSFKTECRNIVRSVTNSKNSNTIVVRQCQIDETIGKKEFDGGQCYTLKIGKTEEVQELCAISYLPKDRITTPYSEGNFEVLDNQLLNVDNDTVIKAIEADQVLREKLPYENGLCIKIPEMGDCAAIDKADKNSKFATWPSSKVGNLVEGKCANGYVPNGEAPRRYCLIKIKSSNNNKFTHTISYGPIIKGECIKESAVKSQMNDQPNVEIKDVIENK